MLKLSYSSLSTYQACPLKWKFKYVDKLPERPRHYFSLGSAVHAGLQRMYSGEACPGADEVVAACMAAWSGAGFRDATHEAASKKEAEDMLRAYHARHSSSWRRPLALEVKFDFRIHHVPVTGYIDRVDVMENGDLRIVDYKTGRPLEPGRELTDEQLTLYHLAAEATWPESRVGELMLLHVPTLAEHTAPGRGEVQLGATMSAVMAAHEAITRGEFGPRPSWKACQWCEHTRLCPGWLP